MARLHDIVFDCAHPASTARFWAEIRRLTALGATVLERHADNVVLADSEGNEFCLS
ncbi:VOC family protein [Streptomyces sp. NPDC097595]|uniref:VOC family protein n=1 Tax=Streptomyces sp. NPDC097595 TaxID=3366090 RepID=UPI00382EFF2D